MIKLCTTIVIALFLTACGSEANSDHKNSSIESKTETTIPENLESVQKQDVTHTTEKVAPKEVNSKPTVEKQTAEKAPLEKRTEPKEITTSSAPAPALAKNLFTLTTLEGKTLHVDEVEEGILFQEHQGKVVFLLFFGYRCPPCLAEIPVLKAMMAEKHDDLEVIAVEVQRLPSEQLKSFKAQKGINYTLISGNSEESSKFISYIGQRAQWGGSIPFLVALNPKGEVKVVHVGGIGSQDFKAIYEKIRLEK